MCCGAKSRSNLNANRGIAAPIQKAELSASHRFSVIPQVQFEYVGKTRMTVLSPITGIRYHFDSPGAQVVVDARDQGMMIHVPDLRPVRFTRNV
jgi:hypothetical protein